MSGDDDAIALGIISGDVIAPRLACDVTPRVDSALTFLTIYSTNSSYKQ